MKPKITTISLLMLLAIFLFCFPANVQITKAQGIIIINSDGSITPSNAPLTLSEPEWGIKFYTLRSNIIDSTIVVQKDSVTIDGAGYSLIGNYGIDAGIELQDVHGTRVINLTIDGFQNGIKIINGGACSIFSNNIINNGQSGIELSGESRESRWHTIQKNTIKDNHGAGINLTGTSSWSTIVNNLIELNQVGIEINDLSEQNTIANNAFIDNTLQFGDYNNQENRWNGDYDDSNGNYWSDYEERNYPMEDVAMGENQDLEGPDEIWDHPYYIYLEADVKDNYPLVEKPTIFDSTISISHKPSSTSGYVNVYFDDDVTISGRINPIVSDAIVTLTIRSNATNSQVEEVTVLTDQYSSYEYLLENIAYPLEFEIEASWEGSSSHNGASSRVLSFKTYWSDQPENAKDWWEIIPGFPFESIIVGLLLALGLIWMSKKKSKDSLLTSK